MIVVVTQIILKSPWKFFSLANYARHIQKEVKASPCLKYKNTGFWTNHYTATMWDNRKDMTGFVRGPAHLRAMKIAGNLATEIRTYTYEGDEIPPWKEVKELLKKGKVHRYD